MRALSAALLLSGFVAVAATAPARAADLPFKAPPMMMPIAPTWSGFYVGVNAGYAWSAAMRTASFTPYPVPPGGGLVSLAGAGAPVDFNMSGATGGFQRAIVICKPPRGGEPPRAHQITDRRAELIERNDLSQQSN